MERITISIDEELARAFDRLIEQRGYRNRSEAVRDLLRSHLEQATQAKEEDSHCVANLSYVYNHHERELSERLTSHQHHHHDLTLATMHAHLDHDNCMESVFLRGPSAQIRAFADAMLAERGVRHGALNLVTVSVDHGSHSHGYTPRGRVSKHLHLKPKN